jgi:DNA-dependent RNA polymerase auxiliary subunit epsilon
MKRGQKTKKKSPENERGDEPYVEIEVAKRVVKALTHLSALHLSCHA